MRLNHVVAEKLIKDSMKESRELREENKELLKELTGAQQVTSFLLQRFAPEGLTVSVKELAEVGGSIRVMFNEDDTVTLVAVTPEQIQQAVEEIAKNANADNGAASDDNDRGSSQLVDASGSPIERGEGTGDGGESDGDGARPSGDLGA